MGVVLPCLISSCSTEAMLQWMMDAVHVVHVIIAPKLGKRDVVDVSAK